MSNEPYVLGVDFGTDSARTLVVNALNGEVVSSAIRPYPRWSQGLYCDPAANRYRQHPCDYIETLETTVREALAQAKGVKAEQVIALGVDTTGSTPVAVDEKGRPLAMLPGFEKNPNAMFVLWKDHTAVEEAAQINEAARTWVGEDYTSYSGGSYSSEWFWSKLLHILREDEPVRKAAFSWVEHCDWIPALLTGREDPTTQNRSRCAAGHKAMWHASWGGLPSEAFWVKLDPLLEGLRGRLFEQTETCDQPAGTLCAEWAARLGLHEKVVVAGGAIDAHLGAVGGEIKPYYLSKVIGTSTCDMLIAPLNEMGDRLVKGICGQVDGSILPGMLGMEAGQSAFGDLYAWFRDLLMWPMLNLPDDTKDNDDAKGPDDTKDYAAHERVALAERIIPALSEAAENAPLDASGLVALDWLNGRRTPGANQALKGAIMGMHLGTDAPVFFRSLVEATAFGSRAIVDCFEQEGVPIKGIIALGGIPKKSPFVMQVLADVLARPIEVARSEQTVALGSAMAAAAAARIHGSLEAAQAAMGHGFEKTYHPDPARARTYQHLYERYKNLAGFVEDELK